MKPVVVAVASPNAEVRCSEYGRLHDCCIRAPRGSETGAARNPPVTDAYVSDISSSCHLPHTIHCVQSGLCHDEIALPCFLDVVHVCHVKHRTKTHGCVRKEVTCSAADAAAVAPAWPLEAPGFAKVRPPYGGGSPPPGVGMLKARDPYCRLLRACCACCACVRFELCQ